LLRRLDGKYDNAMLFPFGRSGIHWTISRGEIVLAGRPEEVTMAAKLSGTFRIAAQDMKTGTRAGGQAGLFGVDALIQDFVTGAIDPHGDIRGQATMSARPSLLANWRIDPNLTGDVTITEGGLSIAGFTVDVSGDIKSAADRAVSEQLELIQGKVRNDATIE
jgi:Domain of unknown function (DUF4403)